MNQVKMEYKKRFSLYHQKRIALIVQERKRKYRGKEKPRYKKRTIWNEKRKNLVHPFAGREGNSTSSERHFYCSKRWKKCHKRKIAT